MIVPVGCGYDVKISCFPTSSKFLRETANVLGLKIGSVCL